MSGSRMLVLVSHFPVPSESFVIDHVVGLARQGWDVTVACFESDERAAADLRQERAVRFEVAVIPMGKRNFLTKLTRAARRLGLSRPTLLLSRPALGAAQASEEFAAVARRVRPDVIHAHWGTNGLVASFGARRLGIPLVVDFHGYDVTMVPATYGWRSYRTLLSGARAVVHSGFVEGLVREHLPLQVTRVLLGVDQLMFRAPERAHSWPTPLKILTVGRLVYQKGHHLALEALALLRHRLPHLELRLTLCGDGPLEPLLRSRARVLGVEDAVTFRGPIWHAEVAREMSEADILLVPSGRGANGWQEAFCRVAIEGLACGLAVVGTPAGGLGDTIGEAGIVVPWGSAAWLARAIEGLVKSTSPADLARAAVARARLFSIEAMWTAYDDVARQALRG